MKLDLDFRDTSFKEVKKKLKERMCIECFMYKNEENFNDKEVCNDCA